MKENRKKYIEFVMLKLEGGYSNIREDRGGETKWGISKKAYPKLNIKKLTFEDAYKIYEKDYWEKLRCDELPDGVDLLVFDAGVNHGVAFAKKIFQKATLEAQSKKELLYHLFLLRVWKYLAIANRNKKQRKFLRGWLNRLKKIWDLLKQGGEL